MPVLRVMCIAPVKKPITQWDARCPAGLSTVHGPTVLTRACRLDTVVSWRLLLLAAPPAHPLPHHLGLWGRGRPNRQAHRTAAGQEGRKRGQGMHICRRCVSWHCSSSVPLAQHEPPNPLLILLQTVPMPAEIGPDLPLTHPCVTKASQKQAAGVSSSRGSCADVTAVAVQVEVVSSCCVLASPPWVQRGTRASQKSGRQTCCCWALPRPAACRRGLTASCCHRAVLLLAAP